MHKTAAILIIAIMTLLTLTGCSGNNKTINSDYHALLDNATTAGNIAEIVEFLDANIAAVDKDTAAEMVVEYREFLLNYIIQNKDKTTLQELNVYIDESCGRIDEEKIKNSESKEYFDQVSAGAMMVTVCDGVPTLKVDHAKLLEKYDNYIPDSLRGLYTLEAEIAERPTSKNAKLMVSWSELLDRTFAAEKLLTDYSDDKLIFDDALWIYTTQLNTVLMGTTNSPIFDYETKEFSSSARMAYNEFITAEPDSVLSWVLKEYFVFQNSIDYRLDFNNSTLSKLFFDTCDWLVSEAEKRVKG